MKILSVNKFLYLKGGAEASLLLKARLLEEKGHKVNFFSMVHPDNIETPDTQYFVSRVDYENPGTFAEKAKAAARILYSIEARKNLARLIEDERPDIVHLHNIQHQISPSILHTLKKFNLPSVMTLHDYKVVCPVYTLFNKGELCEKCKGQKYFRCLFNKCSKNSFSKSFLMTLEMYIHHKILHIYDLVDVFISPSQFLKDKIVEMGFHRDIYLLPNFINIDEPLPSDTHDSKTIVYFGRISQEKGLFTLISAMKGLRVQCKIIGTGPLTARLNSRIADEKIGNVILSGHKSGKELQNEINKSLCVVLPSEWYENNPRSVLETFALGKPVIGSRIGGIPELIADNRNGLTFEPGNPEDLREKILYMIKNPDKVRDMGKNARAFVEKNHAPEQYYQNLMELYKKAIRKHS